jgi:membrane-bound metal-dependent hydrolase YbcI (DUF457 family)
LPPQGKQLASAISLLVGLVLGLDLLWAALDATTASLAFGLIDEPAHLATCAIALLVLVAASGRRPSTAFVVAALVSSVAIDLDHLPGYLGWDGLIGEAPRPFTHSLVPVLALLGFGFLAGDRYKAVMLGIAFGASAHLLRDVATGPGVPLLWPVSITGVGIPYLAYAAMLACAAASALWPATTAGRALTRRRAWRAKGAATALLVAVAAAVLAAPAPVQAAAAKPRISTGAFIPGVEDDPGLIDRFAQETGRHPALISFYRIWGPPLINENQLSAASSRGSVPMLTWEPWNGDEVGVSLWSIAAGEQDAYLLQTAREAAGWDGPIFLRFAHEMNGNWYPWGWGNNGNVPAVFKAAWRRVVDVFRGAGADNVRWVWCPYVSNVRLKQFRRFYPGDRYVDWACLDGFNWGSYRSWQSFEEIFALSYASIAKMTRRPIMIGETGVNQSGGNKPRWLTRSLRRDLPKYRNVRAVVWFSAADHRADFRVNSSPRALAALRVALRQPLFANDAAALLSTPPLLPVKKKKKKYRRGHSL